MQSLKLDLTKSVNRYSSVTSQMLWSIKHATTERHRQSISVNRKGHRVSPHVTYWLFSSAECQRTWHWNVSSRPGFQRGEVRGLQGPVFMERGTLHTGRTALSICLARCVCAWEKNKSRTRGLPHLPMWPFLQSGTERIVALGVTFGGRWELVWERNSGLTKRHHLWNASGYSKRHKSVRLLHLRILVSYRTNSSVVLRYVFYS